MRIVRHGFTRPLCAALAALLVLACIRPCAAQEDPGPRFFRCSVVGEHFYRIMDNDAAQGTEIWLHGSVATGTEVELLALDGPGRNSTVVPYDSGLIFDSGTPPGPLPMTQIPLEAGLGLGPLAVAVTPPGLPYEDLTLNPPSEDDSPPPSIAQWYESAIRIRLYDRNQAHVLIEEAGIPIGVVFDPNRGLLAVITQSSNQSFRLGDKGMYKLFRLDGRLYLITENLSGDNMSTKGFRIHVFQDGEFVESYVNADWSWTYR